MTKYGQSVWDVFRALDPKLIHLDRGCRLKVKTVVMGFRLLLIQRLDLFRVFLRPQF